MHAPIPTPDLALTFVASLAAWYVTLLVVAIPAVTAHRWLAKWLTSGALQEPAREPR